MERAVLAKMLDVAGWLAVIGLWLGIALYRWEGQHWLAIASALVACVWTYRMIRSLRTPKPLLD